MVNGGQKKKKEIESKRVSGMTSLFGIGAPVYISRYSRRQTAGIGVYGQV